MTDWFKTLMSSFERAVQNSGANQRPQEQQAHEAAREGRSVSGFAGVAAALGHVAANASSTNNERLREFPFKGRQGGCDVFVERDRPDGEPIRLRVHSLIYVYSDVVPNALLVRMTAKIQAQINNYWNNRIPVTRTLSLNSLVGGTLAFSYDGLPTLGIAASGDPGADGAVLAAQWRADPRYDAIGNAEVDIANGALRVTFIDDAPRVFADASTGDAGVAETLSPVDPDSLPVGTYFKAQYQKELRAAGAFATGPGDAPQPARVPVDLVFEFEAKPYTFAAELDSAARTREMNRIREEELAAARNVLWVHLNDNDDQAVMTSWASGGLGSFRVNAWPGEYAHETGHFMGHWMPPTGSVFPVDGEHAPFDDWPPNTLMGSASSKSFRRVDQSEVDRLNFSEGLAGRPVLPRGFPGSILREPILNERKTVGHFISATKPDGTFAVNEVIYLDMNNFVSAKPEWRPGD